MESYDLVVIGTGPAGHFGAVQAAKLGKRVAAVEAEPQLGGTRAITGTIPSKALREATMHLTGLRQRTQYGMTDRVTDDLTVEDLTVSTRQLIRHEAGVLEAQLRRNGVELIAGKATLIGPHQLRIERRDVVRRVRAERILIATGSRPAHPPTVAFDGERVIDSSQILHLETLPRTLIVVGAGVIGVEYACIFAALGVRVTLVNQRRDFLEFVDREIVETLKYHMQSLNVDFRLGEEVVDIERMGDFVVASTRSNKKLAADCLLYSIGRQGNTEGLGVEAAGVSLDSRGRVEVNGSYQTRVPHIYAAGDVVGFPALAATAREQGRQAVSHAFGVPGGEAKSKVPYGIYSIPEISMLGPTERELTEQGVPYEIGRARYREIARGQLLGDLDGMLKILFERDTRRVLAVHIIGEGATELIHIGQAAEAFGATLDYFVEAVFNYPTLAECYKVAALDGVNRVRLLSGIIESRGHIDGELRRVVDGGVRSSVVAAPDPVRAPDTTEIHAVGVDDAESDTAEMIGDPWLAEGLEKESTESREPAVEPEAEAPAEPEPRPEVEPPAEPEPRPEPAPLRVVPRSTAEAISGAFPSFQIPRPEIPEARPKPPLEMPRPEGPEGRHPSAGRDPERRPGPADASTGDDHEEGRRHAG